MLVTNGIISKGDYGEESLVSRFIIALILNEFSLVNHPNCHAFKKFSNKCLGLKFSVQDMKKGAVGVEFQANRCSNHPKKTRFDVIFTSEKDWVWGIEAKYFNYLEIDQIEREVKAIEDIANYNSYKNAGVLFVLPEQQLGSIVFVDTEIRKCFVDLMEKNEIHINFTSWEIIFQILLDCKISELSQAIHEFCSFRNKNKKSYPTELSVEPFVKDGMKWKEYIKKPKSAPKNLPRLKKISHSQYDRSSTNIDDIFSTDQIDLVLKIVDISGFVPRYKMSNYANLSKKKRAHAQLHPCDSGVDLAIREAEADEDCPKCEILKRKKIQDLKGTESPRNKAWLMGEHITKSPAIAFTIPFYLINKPNHKGWKEIDTLLKYAHNK